MKVPLSLASALANSAGKPCMVVTPDNLSQTTEKKRCSFSGALCATSISKAKPRFEAFGVLHGHAQVYAVQGV